VRKAHLFISRTRNFCGVLRALSHDLTTTPIGGATPWECSTNEARFFGANGSVQVFSQERSGGEALYV